jgi:hypothetical protein
MSDTHSLPPTFEERQRFTQWWLWVIILGVTAMIWCMLIVQVVGGTPVGNNPTSDTALWILTFCIGVAFPLFMYLLQLIVRVTPNELVIRFFPVHRRRIAIRDIKSCEAREYHPIAEYGGWGIRWGGDLGMAYNVRGNQGVQLELANGKRLLIGTQKPKELESAIRRMMGVR